MVVLTNIGLLATPLGSGPAAGDCQGEISLAQDQVLWIDGPQICGIYPRQKAPAPPTGATVVDAQGLLVTPGLIDCHTHLVFGGWRQHEVPLKLRGASYLEILQMGGGILDTVRQTRQWSEEDLYTRAVSFLDDMLRLGVTTAECKSGYGLSLSQELKQLQVQRKLQQTHSVEIVSTFLGAHAVPPEYEGRSDAYTQLVCQEILPAVAQGHWAEFCDVFCEEGVFTVSQSRKILQTGQELGLASKIHADEIAAIGGSQLAGELGAISAEHLIAISQEGIQALAAGGVIADLLPATSFYLKKPYAPARELIRQNVPVAIASDFNPGSCPSYNLQFAINLAYLYYSMTPEEILTAVTRNAAASLHRSHKIGTLEVGKQADLVIWNAKDLQTLCYRFGSNLVHTVFKKGKIV